MALHEQDRFGNLVPVNFLSRITYSWVNKTLQHGNRSQLQEKDLLELSDRDSSETLVEVLENAWTSEEHLQGANPDKNNCVLLRALFKSFRFQLSILVLLMLFDLLLRILIAVLVGSFVEHLDAVSNTRAFIYSGLLGGLTIAYGVVKNYFMSRLQSLGTQLKTSITGLIYKKVLMLNQKSLHDVTTNHVTHLVSVDCASIQSGCFFISHLAIFPLEVLTITALSWYHINWMSLFATCLIVSLVPVQTALRKLRSRLLYSIKGFSSQRMEFMSKIVTGIQLVKMNVWEKTMFRLVDGVRRNEMRLFQKVMVVLSCQNTIQLSCLTVISIIIFPSLVYLGEGITPVKVFSTLALYTCLAQSALEYISRGFESIPQVITAAQNVEQFLQLEDMHSKQDTVHCRVVGNSRFFVNAGFDRLESFKSSYPANILSFNTLANQNQPSDVAEGVAKQHKDKQTSRVCFQGTSFSWSIKRQLTALSDISLELDDDVIIGVTGPSDSGKTALLLAILHELPLSHGNFSRAGRTVYVPEIPWVFTGSLRDNILCDSPFAEDRYWKVMYACALDKDILEFPNGDLTMIGESAVSLSTDQRTRVSLARAAYCEADIYLFDDNLSYFKNKNSEGLVTKLITEVLSHACRVIVTNNQNILSQCDHVIVMESGRIKHKGTFTQVKEHITNSRNGESGDKLESRDKIKDELSPPIMMTDSEIFTDDVLPVGVSSWSDYCKYLRASPGMFVLLLLLLVVTGQGCMVVTDWWLARWCGMVEGRQTDTLMARTFYGIGTVSVIMALLKSLCLFFTFLKTSDRLHGRMLRAVLKAHISFFDSNSPTRILHRFSKDIHDVDIALPYAMNDYVKSTMFFLSVVIVSIAVNYWLAIACVPLLPLSVCLRRYALRSTRDLNKLKRRFDSDVAAHFKSTLNGLTCIRAFKTQQQFLIDVYRLLNNFTRANTLHSAGLRWLCLREEIVCSMFILAICIAAVLSKTSPGYAGLALVYAIQMFFYIQWIVIATAETDSLMSSFSRISSYTLLKPEHGYNNKHYPPKDWPQEVGVKCVDLSYENESQETLNTTYLDISAKEHVVIIGQKNSGTSSLINALFRMPEPKGRVFIDHVNINQLSLRHARRAIGIVPRYPKLFSTLRCNLDPYGRHSDKDLWLVLEELDLKSKISPLTGSGLDLEITTRVTTTELRLIALAHAFLENKKILIIEEEPDDDWSNKQIHDVIQEHFQDCTVITIAQRLDTIMGSDRVLVMRNGCVTEFDRPHEHNCQNDDELMDIIGQALSI